MYLGIDLGTSSVKVVLMDDEQNILGQSSQTLTLSKPHLLWSEQDPNDWWHATCDAVFELKQQFSNFFPKIKAIGLSGQQHGATLLDENGTVLRPAILWNDGRAYQECAHFSAVIPDYATIIGARMMPGFTAPKLIWVAKHEPDIFKRIAKVLLPKDFLRFKMSGQYATDMSDASGTGWLNIAERAWSDVMLTATGLSTAHMPTLFEGSEVTGTVTSQLAEAWGIPKTTKIVGGGGDNPASAVGINVIDEGQAFLSLGTSGVYFVASESYKTNPAGGVHSFCHSVKNRWHHMTVHLSAASCLSWHANVMHRTEKELLAEVEQSPINNSQLLFLPYLAGERSPHNNPHARGVFFGLTHQTTRADMTRAILEGVAFAFLDGQEAMMHAGITIKDVFVVGGGAQSLYWGKILATVLNRPLIYTKNRNIGGCIGAAQLARLACQPIASPVVVSPIETIIEPDFDLIASYQKKRQRFCQLYRCLESFFINSLEDTLYA